MKIQRNRSECFFARIDEECTAVEEYDRLRSVRWTEETGKPLTPVCLGSSESPFVFRDKDPSPQVQGEHLSRKGFKPVSVEKESEKVRVSLLFLFSQNPPTLNIQSAQVPYLGVVCPESHHYFWEKWIFKFQRNSFLN